MPIDAELKRRLPDGTLTPWRLNQDGTDPVADALGRLLLADIKRGLTDYEVRFAYDISNRPTRIGKAPTGTPVTDATWVVQTFDYGTRTDSKPVRISVTTEAWGA